MWWWVLTSPGVTRQPSARSVRGAGGAVRPAPPSALTRPPVTRHPAAGDLAPLGVQVATSSAPATTRSAAGGPAGTGESVRHCAGRPRRRRPLCRMITFARAVVAAGPTAGAGDRGAG